MTRPSEVSRMDYVGTGITGPYPYTFPVLEVGDLRVVKRSATTNLETVLNYPADFTTADVFPTASGSITLTAVLATSDVLTIRRAPSLTQLRSLRGQGNFSPATYEDVVDHLIDIVQDQQDQLDRTVKFLETYNPASLLLALSGETGKALVWQSPTQIGNSVISSSAVGVPGEGRTVATPTAYLLNNRVFNVKDYGAVGDAVTDDTAAIQLAINNAKTLSQSTVWFPKGDYKIAGSITIPVGLQNAGISLEGDGGGANRKPQLRFTGTAGFTFSGGKGQYLRIARLQIVNTNASAAANGIGLDLSGDAYYMDFDDVWLENWNIDIQVAGNCIYSSWRRVRALYGYTAGVKWNSALMNGNWFEDCNFSQSANGTGLLIADPSGSAGVCFRSCKFEGNKNYGFYQTSAGFLNLKFDTCYAEANGLQDFFIENTFPHSNSLVEFDTCYFDPNNAPAYTQHIRIKMTGCRAFVHNCVIYQMDGAVDPYTSPPIQFTDKRGVQPSIAINNDYETSSFTDDEAGWFIIDSKHPYIGHAQLNPATGHSYHGLKAGDLRINNDEAQLIRTLGWIVEVAGKGVAVNPAGLTAATTSGSKNITPSNSQYPLVAGDTILIAGTTFNRTGVGGGATDAYARVLWIEPGPLVRLDGSANTTVGAGAVTYRQGVASALPRIVRSVDHVTVANNGTTPFTLGGSSYVVFFISESSGTGDSAIVYCTNATLFIVWQNAARYTLVGGSAGKINLTLAAGVVTIENKVGNSNDYDVVQLVVR